MNIFLVLDFPIACICFLLYACFSINIKSNGSLDKKSLYVKLIFVACTLSIINETLLILWNQQLISFNNFWLLFLFMGYNCCFCMFNTLWYHFMNLAFHHKSKIQQIIMYIYYIGIFTVTPMQIYSVRNIIFDSTRNIRYYLKNFSLTWYFLCYLPVFFMWILAVYNRKTNKDINVKKSSEPFIIYYSILLLSGFLELLFPANMISNLGTLGSSVFIYYNFHLKTLYYDELTGVYNRRKMYKDMFTKMLNKNDWALIMLDINDFKKINDRYGHEEGDQALKAISYLISDITSRHRGTVYRYGGDEFIIVKKGSSKEELIALFDDLQSALEDSNSKSKRKYPLSISYGFAIYDDKIYSNPSDIINDADRRMYQMKNQKKAV